MPWRTSTYSGSMGDCVQASEWVKSSYCGTDSCVEVASGTQVRDSKLEEGSPVLKFSPAAWKAFTSRLQAV